MIYYLDLNLETTGNDGTEIEPWSYTDYLTARESILAIGDTVKLKGSSIQTERPEVDSVAKWIIWDRWLEDEPWRLVLDCGIIIPSTIGIIMKNGILYNSTEATQALNIGVNGDVPESVEGQEITNMFIVDNVVTPSQDTGLSIHKDWDINFKGCVFFSNTLINLNEPAPSYYDCIFLGILASIPAGFTTYNCAFDTPDPSIGSHTEPQWSMPWDDDLLPVWDAPKEDFDSSILFPNITIPPEPGYGAPDYVGYETDLWNNERKGIGSGYFKPKPEPKGNTMGKLDNIVKVVITRQTQPVARASYDTILVLGENYTFDERYKLYDTDDLAALAADLTGGTADPEYIAAEAIASQNPRPSKFAAGRVDDGDSDWKDALNAIAVENASFYGIIAATRTVATQEDVCDWVNSNNRVSILSSPGTDVGGGVIDIIDQTKANDSTSIAHHIQNNSLDRCVPIYHEEAEEDYLDAGLLAVLLVRRPGTYTAMFKTVIGSSVDNLTSTQQANAFEKKCSTYEEVGEVNIIQEGWVGTGEFIDLIIWVDWLKSQIQSNVYAHLKNNDKVPFTSEGIASVESRIKQVLKVEQDNGAISPHEFDENKVRIGGWETSVLSLEDVLPADKLARTLKEVKFTAFYSNPIHHVEINGIIKV